MSEFVLDASALIALLRNEPGQDIVLQALPKSIISTVNLTEVYSKAVEFDTSIDSLIRLIEEMPIEIRPLDHFQAVVAGTFREATRQYGLSLGDRCCLGLGFVEKLPVLTTERAMAKLDIGVEIKLIR